VQTRCMIKHMMNLKQKIKPLLKVIASEQLFGRNFSI
jgi:hypothetical protein